MTALVVALAVAVGLLAVLVVGLLRSHAEILRVLHDLGVNVESGTTATTVRRGAPVVRTPEGVPEPRAAGASLVAADLAGVTPDGGVARVAVSGHGTSTLLAFLSTGCLTCAEFWRAFARPLELPGAATRLVVVTKGPEHESPAAVREVAPDGVTVLMSDEAWDLYEVPVSPYFLLVDPERGVIGEGAGTSWSQVSGLLERALADAGLDPRTTRTRRQVLGGRERSDRADRELAAAGILPADPSLHEPPVDLPADPAEAGGPAEPPGERGA